MTAVQSSSLTLWKSQEAYKTTSGYTAADANPNASPRDLILHESVRQLVSEVADLAKRCDGVERAHQDLITRVGNAEQAHRSDSVTIPSSTTRDLTGYASSASSSDDEDNAQHEQHRANFQTMANMFVGYEERLLDLTQHYNRMETLVGELVRYKRQSQSLFAALRGELGSLDDSIPAAKRMTSTSSQAMPAHIGDQDGLEMRIEQLEATLKTCMDGIGNKAVGSTAPTSNVSEPATNAERIKKLEVTMVRVVEHCKKAESKARQEQLIDDASTKDALYRCFADLSSMIASGDDGMTRTCGEFHGTFSELWPLRDRVVYRLASFDSYVVAFQEAKTADLG